MQLTILVTTRLLQVGAHTPPAAMQLHLKILVTRHLVQVGANTPTAAMQLTMLVTSRLLQALSVTHTHQLLQCSV
jgi:hypothetical protein